MAEHLASINGTAVMVCAPDGIPIDTEGVLIEVIGEAIGLRAEVVVVPAERLTDDFFAAETGVAEHITNRFATYRLRLAVVGDTSRRVPVPAVPAAPRLRAAWSDGDDQPWFCGTFHDFQRRLGARKVVTAIM